MVDGVLHRWKIGRYRFGIWRMINAMEGVGPTDLVIDPSTIGCLSGDQLLADGRPPAPNALPAMYIACTA